MKLFKKNSVEGGIVIDRKRNNSVDNTKQYQI